MPSRLQLAWGVASGITESIHAVRPRDVNFVLGAVLVMRSCRDVVSATGMTRVLSAPVLPIASITPRMLVKGTVLYEAYFASACDMSTGVGWYVVAFVQYALLYWNVEFWPLIFMTSVQPPPLSVMSQ